MNRTGTAASLHAHLSLLLPLVFASAVEAQIVRGTVLSPKGKPVSGARVVLAESYSAQSERQDGLRGMMGLVTPAVLGRTKTGAKGAFALDASRMWPGQEYSVWVHTDRFADGRIARFDPPDAGERQLGVVRLEVKATMRGCVTTEDEAKTPIANAWVRCLPAFGSIAAPDRREGWVTRTDAAGRFTITNIPAAGLTVVASAAGRGAVIKKVDASDAKLPAIDFALPKGVAATGTVRSTTGAPIAGAEIVVGSMEAHAGGFRPVLSLFAKSDAKGRFELHGFVPGAKTAIQARAGGFQPSSHEEVVPEGGIRVGLELRALPKIRLLVVDEEEKQVFQIRTRMIFGTSSGGNFVTPRYYDGRAVVYGFTKGEYRLDVRSPGFAVKRSAKMTLRGGETRDLTLRLDRGGTLTGIVLDAAGKPVRGAKVVGSANPSAGNNPFLRLMAQQNGNEVDATTDDEGRYRVALLRPATYHLTISHAGFAETSAKAAVKSNQVTSVGTTKMDRGALLTGTTTQGGKPVGARVTVTNLTTRKSLTVHSDGKGKFKLATRLSPGRYQVMAFPTKNANPLQMMVAANKNKVAFEIKAGAETHEIDVKWPK